MPDGCAADCELLRDYAESGSEAAFAEVVRRHVGFVHAAALRQLGGDGATARDVTQLVFIDLARKAATLARHTAVAGWLHTATRYAAAKAIRAESRRKAREQAAGDTEPANLNWEAIRPVIDDLLGQLRDRERTAIILRYFEGKALADVGAHLALTEPAVRSCIDRALEKMRARLARRGVQSSGAALGSVLAEEALCQTPVGLVASVAQAAVQSSAAGGAYSVATVFLLMKKPIVIIAALVLLGEGTVLVNDVRANAGLAREAAKFAAAQTETRRLQAETSQLEADLATLGQGRPDVAELARLEYTLSQVKKRPAGVAEAGMKARAEWRNAGTTTPRDTYETAMWVSATGDVDGAASLLRFSGTDKLKLDKFYSELPEPERARYLSPERMFALALAGRDSAVFKQFTQFAGKPTSRGEIEAFQIYREDDRGDRVIFDGWTRNETGYESTVQVMFIRGEGRAGWGVTFPSGIVDDFFNRFNPATGEWPKAGK